MADSNDTRNKTTSNADSRPDNKDNRIPLGGNATKQLTSGEMKILFCWLPFVLLNAYMVLFHPASYWKCYTVSIVIVYAFRGYDYGCLSHKVKNRDEYWTYFLFDFCYFVGILSLVNLYIFNSSPRFYNAMYILGNCPLLFAVIVWRNSFVLYDMDKMLSCCIHMLPSLLYYTTKWWHNGNIFRMRFDMGLIDFAYASGIYIVWQILYYIKTEIRDADFLNKHPEYITSLRWISVDEKNSMRAISLKACRVLNVFREDEVFDPTSAKTKLVFMTVQFLYTFFLMIPGYFLYSCKIINELFIAFVLWKAFYNAYTYHLHHIGKAKK